ERQKGRRCGIYGVPVHGAQVALLPDSRFPHLPTLLQRSPCAPPCTTRLPGFARSRCTPTLRERDLRLRRARRTPGEPTAAGSDEQRARPPRPPGAVVG